MNYQEYYLDYLNNWLTVDRFAEYYNMTITQAYYAINKGRVLHQDKFGYH